MSSEGFLKEMQTIGEKFLLKLQKLPKADPVEIVSFCVVLLFIGEFISGGKGLCPKLSYLSISLNSSILTIPELQQCFDA
uniref:Small integral membrane protein 5 n=1 Tax=Accipiter nisus TaxID=211598 RepID=A0A8B9ML58_9AVES